MSTLVRVYNSGTRVIVDDATPELVQYSIDFRPGCALFLDGEIVQTGYLGQERCEEIARELRTPAALAATTTQRESAGGASDE